MDKPIKNKPSPDVLSLDNYENLLLGEFPAVAEQMDLHRDAQKFCARIRLMLRALREHCKLDQTALAKRLGVTQPAISRLERNGGGDVGLQTLYRFAATCGYRPVINFVPTEETVRNRAAPYPTRASRERGKVREVSYGWTNMDASTCPVGVLNDDPAALLQERLLQQISAVLPFAILPLVHRRAESEREI